MNTDEQKLNHFFSDLDEVISPVSNLAQQLNGLISNFPLTIKLLLLFVDNKENEPSLERLADDFHQHLHVLLSDDLHRFPIAIEGLAQKFEAFLKKIGYFKYKNTVYWTGDSTHIGLIDSTLQNICDGLLVPVRGMPRGTGARRLPENLFINSGFTEELVDFIRGDLRNNVHQAPNIPRRMRIYYSELVLLAYLLVINDNGTFLAAKLLTEQRYKSKLSDYFSRWQDRYVQNLLIEKDKNDLVELSPQLIETDWDVRDQESLFLPKSGKILDIVNDVKQLVIIGDPGLGKTTTLYFLGYHLAKDDQQIPLYFPFKNFNPHQNLLQQIATNAGLEKALIESFKGSGLLVFLLDGLNEVLIASDAIHLKNEIKSLQQEFPDCYLVITTRPSSYRNDFNIPVFDLQPLSDHEIIEFITKHFTGSAPGLVAELNKHIKLRELCRNPLILLMLCSISDHSLHVIPQNKGQLIKKFIADLLIREQLKNSYFDEFKYFNYLVDLGYATRQANKVSFDRNYAINILSRTANRLDPSVDRVAVLKTLIDIGILSKNQGLISFTHELYQEYFAAEGLILESFSASDFQKLEESEVWEQPLILYSGLTNQSEQFIANLSFRFPVLAAKCFESSIADNELLRLEIVKNAYNNSLLIDDFKTAIEGLTALLRIGESKLINDSLQTSVNNHGEIVFRFLGQIASILVRTIDSAYLIESIATIINLRPAFIPSVIRNLEKRNREDILKLKDELLKIFQTHLFLIKPPFLLRFFRTIDLKEANKIGKDKLEKYCLRLCQQDNNHILEDTNVAWNLIDFFELYNDIEFISQLLPLLIDGRRPNHIFIRKIADRAPAQVDKIIVNCLSSQNVSSQCAGIFLAIDRGKFAHFEEVIHKLKVYRNVNLIKWLDSFQNEKMFNDRVSVIYNLESQRQNLVDLEKHRHRKYRCKVVEVNPNYISIKQRDYRITGRVLPSERVSKNVKASQMINAYVAFIDYFANIIYFTQRESSVENYFAICQMPAPGEKVRARISYIENDYAELYIRDRFLGILLDEPELKTSAKGKKLDVKILSYEFGIYKLQLIDVKKVGHTKIKREKEDKDKSKRSAKEDSDFAYLLSLALKK